MKHQMSHHFWLAIFMAVAVPEMPVSALKLQLPNSNQRQCFGLSKGKHFVLGFTDNTEERSHTRKLYILVVAFSNQQTSVTISSKHPVEGKQFQKTFEIDAGGFRRTNIPAELIMDGNERSFKGIDIKATSEVSAYGLIYQDYTTDGFLGIPTNNLGMQYVVVTPTRGLLPSQFAVIGTEDSTLVQVALRGAVTFEGQTYHAGDVLRFMVNELEAVHIQGENVLQDLTGSIIQTDKPVSVFSGNECVRHGGSACDTVTEQLVPIKSWGRKHIFTASRGTDSNIYKLVAFASGTVVTIPGLQDQSLEPGEFWEGRLVGSGLVSSSKPTLMMQQLTSVNGETVDPSFIQVPAEEQFGFEFGFTTPPHSGGDYSGYFNFINIIVQQNSRQTVYLNGSPINDTNVVESNVPNTNYTSLTVQLPKGEGVYFVKQTDRRLSPLSVIVYGYESFETYGYAAGLSLPSNEQHSSLTPYFLRELGGETFTITVPCLQTNALSHRRANCKCNFSTGFGDVLVSGDCTDAYTIVCITPTFYKTGLSSVYVSFDDGSTFPYSGVVYIASEEDLPPLLNVKQMNSADGSRIIDLTSDDPILLSWDPTSLGEDISHVTLTIQDTQNDRNGNPVLMDGVALKTEFPNNQTLNILPKDLTSIFKEGISLSAFHLTRSGLRNRRSSSTMNSDSRLYSGVTGIFKSKSNNCDKHLERLQNVPTGLTPCPCTLTQARADSLNFEISNHKLSYYHPAAKNCFRSAIQSQTGSGQQCCYRGDGNILVGPPGGGTADRYSPSGIWNTALHYWYDVLTWEACCKKSDNCHTYYKYRPSDDCSGYVPPRPAGGTGDPHLTSLDGHKFTFNGAGEFLMASSVLHNLTFQARMERYRNTEASVYTAFVLQTNDSSSVQVQMSNMNETMILVDGEPLRLDSIPVRVHHLRGVRISFNPDLSTVKIAFSAGIAVIVNIDMEMMSFIAQLDTKFQGQVKGLLGNLNGDPNDDLKFPNGTIMKLDSSLRELHEFGLEWLVTRKDSIFTYISPYDYSTYHFPDFSPIFEAPDLNEVGQEIKDLCGNSIECVFDAVTTGSLSFANETLVVSETISNIQKASITTVTCGFPGVVDNGTVSGSVYLVNETVEVTCHDGSLLEGSSILICEMDGHWSSDLPRCISITCGVPGEVENGEVTGSLYIVNASLEVTCDDGYNLVGSSRLTCQPDGQWSSDIPRCISMEDVGLSPAVIAIIVIGALGLILAVVGWRCRSYLPCFEKKMSLNQRDKKFETGHHLSTKTQAAEITQYHKISSAM